jgi:hypothetical protein
MQRLPNLTGLKNEVVVPLYSRNEYDHAVRMLGVEDGRSGPPRNSKPPWGRRPPWS